MLINRWMENEVWYIYTVDVFSGTNKTEIMEFAGKWMDLEIITKWRNLDAKISHCICFSLQILGFT